MVKIEPKSANLEWSRVLSDVFYYGRIVSPRGQKTIEIPQHTAVIDMRRPVITIPERKLSTKFLAGEAYWILSGDDKVENIAPYNKNIANYSDDGVTFFGAYGPRIAEQLDYVTNKLLSDNSTRQALLTIWRPNPPETKDVPCTISCGFMIRDGNLDCYVYMRSNDLWLGFPYDIFNFSMLSHLVCCRLNKTGLNLKPGIMYHTAASRHIYEQHSEQANYISGFYNPITSPIPKLAEISTNETPDYMFNDEEKLMQTLDDIRNNGRNSEMIWWK